MAAPNLKKKVQAIATLCKLRGGGYVLILPWRS